MAPKRKALADIAVDAANNGGEANKSAKKRRTTRKTPAKAKGVNEPKGAAAKALETPSDENDEDIIQFDDEKDRLVVIDKAEESSVPQTPRQYVIHYPHPSPGPKRKSDWVERQDRRAAENKKICEEYDITWEKVCLDGEEELKNKDFPIYDNCDEIRRKIEGLKTEPGFKITHWLREIGNINNNSYRRFMGKHGEQAGAESGFYLAAYKHFEKRRIVNGIPKSMTRLENEKKYPKGLPRVDENRPVYVTVGPGEDPYQIYLESME